MDNPDRRKFLAGGFGVCAGLALGPKSRQFGEGEAENPLVGRTTGRSIDYFVVDVFTDRPLAGNPVAVFPDRSLIGEEELIQVARELNLSETVFVEPPRDPTALRRLRIFSLKMELPLAGHPVIGAWHLLCHRGFVDLDQALSAGLAVSRLSSERTEEIVFRQELISGVLDIAVNREGKAVTEVAMDQLPPTFHGVALDHELIAKALGIETSGIGNAGLPAEVVSTGGTPKLMIPLASVGALESIDLNLQAFDGLCEASGSKGIYPFALGAPQEWALVRARCFSQAIGGREDPATGSAAGCLGGYLAKHGVIKPAPVAKFCIAQGFEIDRPSRIGVEVTAEGEKFQRIRVFGSAVVVAEARLFLP